MKVLLNLVIREEDNNGSVTKLSTLYKYEEVMITPELKTRLILKGWRRHFYIHDLFQDLDNQVVVLVHYYDLYYRHNRNDEWKIAEKEYLQHGWEFNDGSSIPM